MKIQPIEAKIVTETTPKYTGFDLKEVRNLEADFEEAIDQLYTEEELQEAIKQESELCALICDNYHMKTQFGTVGEALEECSIRIRSKE